MRAVSLGGWGWLAWLPILATALFYALPSDLQSDRAIQFFPQAMAYASLALWASRNAGIAPRLGLQPAQIDRGLRWGIVAGLTMGTANAGIILQVVPRLGYDIAFLRETPHAQIPPAIMLPWLIVAIAMIVEVNFRGFLLGRLLALAEWLVPSFPRPFVVGVAIGVSALTFSFDPFMVVTFRHLHWIALWDGLVWGLLWVWLRNLYVPIVAHAIEVMIMYSVIKMVLNA